MNARNTYSRLKWLENYKKMVKISQELQRQVLVMAHCIGMSESYSSFSMNYIHDGCYQR